MTIYKERQFFLHASAEFLVSKRSRESFLPSSILEKKNWRLLKKPKKILLKTISSKISFCQFEMRHFLICTLGKKLQIVIRSNSNRNKSMLKSLIFKLNEVSFIHFIINRIQKHKNQWILRNKKFRKFCD